MLRRLKVENYALIDRLELELDDRLNIITGETGVGKSILLGALGLLLGNKNDNATLKDDKRNCLIEGVFDLGTRELQAFFDRNDLDYSRETTLTRQITPAGKSRSFINDTPVPLALLRELGSQLIDIHSQHQNLILGSEAFRMQAVDTVAENHDLRMQYTTLYERLCHLRRELARLREEAEAILDQIALLDDNFEKAVDLMYHCEGKIIVTGVGKSGHVGAKIAATLASTGTPAFYINPLDVYHGDLGVMTDKDVVLALSNSGQTDELLRFIPMVLHMNVPIISMTGNPQSLLAKYSNYHITVKVKKEACPLNLAPTSSTTAALAMGDALAIALMQVRHFKPRDFAQFHPGGELGKRLLTTAEDVMKKEDLPIIPKDMHLGEAIIHVSKGKLGLGVSVDKENRVIGLITDGDIRRAMEKWQAEFFNKTVNDIMTTSPKHVAPTTKITEIQHIMHQYKVHTVLVMDDEKHLLGIVDHYACMV